MKKYLITSREFYTDTPAVFRKILHEQFIKQMPEYALYRDKSNPNYTIQAEHFIEVCNQFMGIKGFIHRDYALAKQLHAHGVHLTSTQFDDIQNAKALGLEVIISTHTHEEVLKAKELGADAVTYSPIFSSPGKAQPKGVEDLKALLELSNMPIFALGGVVTQEHIEILEKIEVFGFASIRYFY